MGTNFQVNHFIFAWLMCSGSSLLTTALRFFLVMKLPVIIHVLNKLPQGCVALQLLVQGHSSAVLPLPSAAVALEAPRLVAASFYTEGGDPRAGQFPAAAKQGCARLFPKV